MSKEKQVIYFEAACTEFNGAVVLVTSPVKDTGDYEREITKLRQLYSSVEVWFRAWDDGTTEDGVLEDL